ncbi:MAG: hypothetical protein ACYTDY_11495 [Planctomycetota bacterium]|jgi:hypothetical protein
MSLNRISLVAVLVLAVVLLPASADGRVPIDVTGAGYDTIGIIKGKVLRVRLKGPGTARGQFGPSADAGPGEFVVTVDDGATPFDVRGSYQASSRGRLVFTPDIAALESEMDRLFGIVLDAFFSDLLVDPNLKITVPKAKAKIVPRSKKGQEVAKVKVKFKFVTTAESGGQTRSVKAKLGYKGLGFRTQ